MAAILGKCLAGMLAVAAGAAGEVRIREGVYESARHLVVKAAGAEWWYDEAGGGFSRIVDRDGRDWIGFRREPWNVTPASAASSYRGLPNLVFGGPRSGAGHPGFGHCESGEERGSIFTRTRDGEWAWRWSFAETHAALRIEKKGPEPYWFLYEGTPGGRYEPRRWYWGHSGEGPLRGMPDFLAGERALGEWEWAYFGSDDAPRVFWVAAADAGPVTASFGVMGDRKPGLEAPDGMVVFGLGRAREARPLLERAPAVFLCGFYERPIRNSRDHERLARHVERLRRKPVRR